MPEVLKNMTKNDIKNKAAEYSDLYMNNGNYAEQYKKDCKNNVFTPEEALSVIRLTDVYISVKKGRYTRKQGTDKQSEILRQFNE